MTFAQYIEVDFSEVVLHKRQVVERHRPLQELKGLGLSFATITAEMNSIAHCGAVLQWCNAPGCWINTDFPALFPPSLKPRVIKTRRRVLIPGAGPQRGAGG